MSQYERTEYRRFISTWRGEWIPHKCATKRGEDRPFILLHCWERSPNPAERGSYIITPESTRNFLLEFDHPDIAFGLIVRRGDGEIVRERKDLTLELSATVKKISGFRLLPSTAFHSWENVSIKRRLTGLRIPWIVTNFLLITAIHRFCYNCYQNNPITWYSIRFFECSRDLQKYYK